VAVTEEIFPGPTVHSVTNREFFIEAAARLWNFLHSFKSMSDFGRGFDSRFCLDSIKVPGLKSLSVGLCCGVSN
jgi:hypothetical protein